MGWVSYAEDNIDARFKNKELSGQVRKQKTNTSNNKTPPRKQSITKGSAVVRGFYRKKGGGYTTDYRRSTDGIFKKEIG